MMRKLQKQAGFTLLEVLVSFVILSGVLGIVYQLLLTGTLQSNRSEKKFGAILIAKSKMAEPIVEIGQTMGITDQYNWMIDSRRITAEEDGNYPAKLVNLKVTVTWDELNGSRELTFETMKLIAERR